MPIECGVDLTDIPCTELCRFAAVFDGRAFSWKAGALQGGRSITRYWTYSAPALEIEVLCVQSGQSPDHVGAPCVDGGEIILRSGAETRHSCIRAATYRSDVHPEGIFTSNTSEGLEHNPILEVWTKRGEI